MFSWTTRWRARGWYWAVALSIGCTVPAPALAQQAKDKEVLESIFKDWQERQSILKSARYVLEGTTEFKDEQLPAGNPNRPRRITLLLDLARKRYRMEDSQDVISANGSYDPKQWEFRHRIKTTAYDGEALQSLAHRKANRLENDRDDDLLISKGADPGAGFQSEVFPIFFAHGIVPTVHSPIEKWPSTHDPDDFDVSGRQMLGGQNYLIVRTEPLALMSSVSDEFWINRNQKSTIYRRVTFVGSNPSERLDVSWKNAEHGWWVDHWSVTWSPGGRVRRIFRLSVESFEANPEVSDSDFKFPAEPGMIVKVAEGPPPGKGLDPFKAAITTYRISPSGAWEEIAATGFTTLEGKELPPERHGKWLVWGIVGGLAIAALLFYVVSRRWKQASL